MIEINLIPDVKLELIKARRTRATVITGAMVTCVVAVGLVIALAVNVFVVQWGRGVYLDGRIDDMSKDLKQTKNLSKMLTIQNQLSKISQLNDSKHITSRMFDVLTVIGSTTDPDKVVFNDASVDTLTKKITINGEAGGYSDVEIFKKTVQGIDLSYTGKDKTDKHSVRLASEVSLSNANSNDGGSRVIQFTISFTYPEELFLQTSKNIKLTQQKKGNVTDSYLGIPSFVVRDQ